MPIFDLESINRLACIGTVFHAPSMSSTSDVAKKKMLTDVSIQTPLLVLCGQQTAGRGQPGKSWESNADSLTFTWCIDVGSVPAANHGLLPLIAGFSICEAIESIGIANAKLKWPNDVLIERKKVCGILVERISSGDQAWFLIGIGINVNQTAAELASLGSSSSSFPASSLRASLDQEIQPETLLENALRHLQSNTMRQNWPQDLSSRFDFLGEQISFSKTNGEVVTGIFHGVDDSGRIEIDVAGKTQRFTSGQVTLVRN